MRHRVYGKHLGRDNDQRTTLFKGLVRQLFTYGTIQTSEVKAKAIKGLVDKVITLAKDKKSESRVQSIIADKDIRDRLISEIAPKLSNRNSGYTSIVKIGARLGDQSLMVKMSLIGIEQLKPIEKKVTGNRLQVTDKKTEIKEAKKTVEKAKVEKTVKKVKVAAKKKVSKGK